jgi:hypothetical protein
MCSRLKSWTQVLKSWRRRLNAVRALREYCLRQTCTADAAAPTASFVTIAAFLSCRDRARHVCVRSWRNRLAGMQERRRHKEVTSGRNDSRSGKLCNRVARHAITLSGFGAILLPPERRWSLPFFAALVGHAKAAFRFSRGGNGGRRFWSGCWQSHRRHRLMTYALIASKTATLMAIMIKKNFPIALPLADPNAKQPE